MTQDAQTRLVFRPSIIVGRPTATIVESMLAIRSASETTAKITTARVLIPAEAASSGRAACTALRAITTSHLAGDPTAGLRLAHSMCRRPARARGAVLMQRPG